MIISFLEPSLGAGLKKFRYFFRPYSQPNHKIYLCLFFLLSSLLIRANVGLWAYKTRLIPMIFDT